jgi:peptide-methionine (S)-S-oxide reductase
MLAACESSYAPKVDAAAPPQVGSPNSVQEGKAETAVFAGGCFWCTEADFEKVPGVLGAVSGYTGGTSLNPTYEQVSAGGTGHYEAVQVTYDPARVSYEQLADYFLRTVDPLDADGQFCDRGESYRTALFVANDAQRSIAERETTKAGEELGQPVVTPILPAGAFYEAEGYHQDYSKRNSLKYRYYRGRCGRDARLAELWGNKE